MESEINFAEEQQPLSPQANSWTNKQDQKPKVFGGFVLVHAGKSMCFVMCFVEIEKKHQISF